jgi:SAM-dependent methyltransferase
MSQSVDLYGTAYGNFAAEVLAQVRRDTYGEDFGQSSWVTGPEYRRFFQLLELAAADHVLDVGCGSGGPALFLAQEAGCRVTGVDVSETGIQAGLTLARQAGLDDRANFRRADVREPLPFPAGRSTPSSAWTRCATCPTGAACSGSGAASCGPAAACSTRTRWW